MAIRPEKVITLKRKSFAPSTVLKYLLAYVLGIGLVENIKIQVMNMIKKLPLRNA